MPRLVKSALESFRDRVSGVHLDPAPPRIDVKFPILGFLMDPNIAFIILMIGAAAIYAEFNHPGAVIPGVVGIIFVVLAVFALNLLPVRFAGVALILTGRAIRRFVHNQARLVECRVDVASFVPHAVTHVSFAHALRGILVVREVGV